MFAASVNEFDWVIHECNIKCYLNVWFLPCCCQEKVNYVIFLVLCGGRLKLAEVEFVLTFVGTEERQVVKHFE